MRSTRTAETFVSPILIVFCRDRRGAIGTAAGTIVFFVGTVGTVKLAFSIDPQ